MKEVKTTKTTQTECCSKPASGCGCGLKLTCLCGSILGSGMIVAAAILFSAPTKPAPIQQVKTPVAASKPVADDAAFKKFVEENPQFIVDTLNNHMRQEYEKRQKEIEEEEAKNPPVAPQEIIDEILKDKSNHSLGNPKGKYVIIEFFDYNCGWCKKTNEEMYKAISAKTGKNIRWIPIDTPIFGENSELVARYVLAAGKQGKYAQMHDAVVKAKKLDKDSLIAMAKKIGLNTKKLTADADGKEIKAKLEANQQYAEKLKINGVPMLIVNGKINRGALFGPKLEEAVKESQEMK